MTHRISILNRIRRLERDRNRTAGMPAVEVVVVDGFPAPARVYRSSTGTLTVPTKAATAEDWIEVYADADALPHR